MFLKLRNIIIRLLIKNTIKDKGNIGYYQQGTFNFVDEVAFSACPFNKKPK